LLRLELLSDRSSLQSPDLPGPISTCSASLIQTWDFGLDQLSASNPIP